MKLRFVVDKDASQSKSPDFAITSPRSPSRTFHLPQFSICFVRSHVPAHWVSVMPPKATSKPATQQGQKRKAPAAFDKDRKSSNNPRTKRQNTQRDARTLAVQTTSKAFKNGELDVDKFVKAREYEIRALEEGLLRSKKALTTRAFQQVPKELRRRTASHNAARVPNRLRGRAKREVSVFPTMRLADRATILGRDIREG